MKHLLILWCLLGFAGCMADSGFVKAHRTTLHLTIFAAEGSGSCSATAIGPHAILTAAHCMEHLQALDVNGKQVKVKKVLLDGSDHAIAVLDMAFTSWATISKEPGQGGEVFIIGNPGDLSDQYREGHVSGYVKDSKPRWTLYDLNGFFGDSGSGIFDADGHLVAVISVEYSQAYGDAYMKLMGSLPLAFTPEQWEAAGISGD